MEVLEIVSSNELDGVWQWARKKNIVQPSNTASLKASYNVCLNLPKNKYEVF